MSTGFDIWKASGQQLIERYQQPNETALALSDPNYQVQLDLLNRQNAFNAEQAQLTRDWQESMSNTAYQRASDDLRSAGLNPYLAYQQGGASTPSGATASASSSAFNLGRKNLRERTAQAVGIFSNLIGRGFSALGSVMSAQAMANATIKSKPKGVRYYDGKGKPYMAQEYFY